MENEHGRRSERRYYVRHRYSLGERPMAEIDGRPYPILDICGHGLGIETPPGTAFEEGATVDVMIRFAGGDELARSGEIIHMQGSHAGILLSEAIPSAYFSRE